MVVIGGMFSFLGPALGAGVYTLGNQYLVNHTHDWQLILGAVLLIIVLLRPDGLAGLLSPSRWWRWLRRRANPPRRIRERASSCRRREERSELAMSARAKSQVCK